MKRLLVLATIVAVGAVTIASGLVASQAPQGGAAPPAGQRGDGQARGGGGGLGPIGMIQKVADRLYMIPGAGGNTAVFITDGGIVLVDPDTIVVTDMGTGLHAGGSRLYRKFSG